MPEIRVDLIAPFVKATVKVFQSMINMNVTVQRDQIRIKNGHRMYGEITGVIGMTGSTTGTCAVSLKADFAVKCIQQMLGESVEGIYDAVTHDGIGEIVNMIAGHAKSLLEGIRDPATGQQKYRFNITLPTIISGAGHELYQKSGTVCVVIPFQAEGGQSFALDICVVDVK